MIRRRAAEDEPDRDWLNEHQQRRVLVTCRHVDRLLRDAGDILTAPPTPFARHRSPLSSVQRQTVAESIATIRADLVWALDQLKVPRPQPGDDAVFAARTTVDYAGMAVDDLRPESMAGYGSVPPGAAETLNAVVDRLSGLLKHFGRFLASLADSDQDRIEGGRRAGDAT